MRWWDFTDLKFLLLFIIIVVIFIVLILLTTTFLVSLSSDKKFNLSIANQKLSKRIYVINPKYDMVEYFDKSNPRKRKITDIARFYEHFHQDDRAKVRKWVSDIFTQKDHSQFLQSDIVVNHGRTQFFSLLKLLKYDPEAGLIHLESYLLQYISPINSSKKIKTQNGIVSKDFMQNLINTRKNSTGFLFCIRFFSLSNQINNDISNNESMALIPQNIIYPFVALKRHQRYLLVNNQTELFLFDMIISKNEDAVLLASSLVKNIQQEISINGLDNYLSFSIGFVQISQYYHHYEGLVSTSQQACIYAQQNNLKHYLFSRSVDSPVVENGKYEYEISRLLRPHALRFLFRPIVDCEKGRISSYFTYVKAFDTPFNGYLEMNKYATQIGKNKDLFSVCAKQILNTFNNEKLDPNHKVYISIAVSDTEYALEILKQIPAASYCKLVLLFDEEDINSNVSDQNSLSSCLLKLKSAGYMLGLSLGDNDLLLSTELYTLFDSFVVGASVISDIGKNDRIRVSLRTMIEQLLKYHQPIIANELDSMSSVELIIKSGINYVSSEALGKMSEMILPIEKKKIDKLVNLFNQY